MGISYSPQAGPQTALLTSEAQEIFYGGARGGGKTFGILLDWLRHYLAHASKGTVAGIVFRRTYPELEDIVTESLALFPAFGGEYKYTKRTWFFPGGATLKLRHLDRDTDATRYQGHHYDWMAVDEAGAWPDPGPLWMLKATLRSAAGVPSKLILTGNPGGVGQTWLRERYIDSHEPYEMVPDEEDSGWWRTFIPAKVWDNRILLDNDPGYIGRLKQVGNAHLVKAWLNGDWYTTPGMYLEGVWDAEAHICDPFEIPLHWKRFRSLDWGFAAPYSVLWYCADQDGKLYVYRELYGKGPSAGKGTREEASAVAARIKDIEQDEIDRGCKFLNNPADPSIWMQDGRYRSIADIFMECGVGWSPAKAGPGSRINGAQEVVNRLRTNMLCFFSTCRNALQHIPMIPADPQNPEDVDTDCPTDHDFDSLKYGLVSRQAKTRKPDKKDKPTAGTARWVTEKSTYKPETSVFDHLEH